MHMIIRLMILSVGLFCSTASLAHAAEQVFSAPSVQAANDAPVVNHAAKVLRARQATVNLSLLFPAGQPSGQAKADNAGPRAFNLFDNRTVTVTPQHWEVSPDGKTQVFVGQNDNATGGETRIANTNGTIYGVVRTNGPIFYEITPMGSGYQIREVDQSTFPNEMDALPPPDSSAPAAPQGNASPSAQQDDGAVIDVMVVYTAAAKNAVGGAAAMASLINTAFSETNQGYTNSGVTQRYRLVHSAEVSYDESSGFDDALDRLQNTSDGYMDEIHALRDQYGADIVSLFIDNTDYCGLGYLMRTLSADFATYAFNVVAYTCATGYYSFAHECGHNQGAHHDRASLGGDSGLYSYSNGYQQLSATPTFRTIMAYNCNPSCTRVNYWSNPEVSYNGYPTGVLYTAADSADNRMTLNNTRTTAANWRQAVATGTGSLPAILMLFNQ